ncbi:DUF559 domain-containing protein [uncultured Parasphingopyxis sp.]|uniref:endonuclease domain-containing protein n=1 Tax=uncultured Parasphingopyxis sp. TaxID=1547918 RepID=UPI0026329501|nr:DUF559 domain-containing protein [uncultured Parasphingopyxis sp.]
MYDREASPSPLAGEGGARARQRVGGRGDELRERAKQMRCNPTDAERRVWSLLRAKRLAEFKFKRQVVIDRYIVDFVNFRHRVIIEADGSQHAESTYDTERDAYLRVQGFAVLRFWNNEILNNPNGVAEAILAALVRVPSPTATRQQAAKSPFPLPQGERSNAS